MLLDFHLPEPTPTFDLGQGVGLSENSYDIIFLFIPIYVNINITLFDTVFMLPWYHKVSHDFIICNLASS